jgi:ribonuclease J
MSHGDHPHVNLREGDSVIFSATPIPGNERSVNETIDRIYHLGADVITPEDAPVHASGHAFSEELKLMINLTEPRYVFPFHGDHRRLRLHAELAEAVGIDYEDIFRAENGTPVEIDSRGARFGAKEQAGMIFVDGVDVGSLEDVALRDRRMLSADGIFIVVVTISEQSGQSVAPPEIIFRGVPFMDDDHEMIDDLRGAVEDSLERSAAEEVREISLLQAHLHDDIAQSVYDRLRRRPMILPVVVEV